MKRWIWNQLIWIDQGANVTLSPLLNWAYSTDLFGSPDESISSVTGKLSKQGKAKRTESVINWIAVKLVNEENHCQISIEADETPIHSQHP